jgi:hypothetical protein
MADQKSKTPLAPWPEERSVRAKYVDAGSAPLDVMWAADGYSPKAGANSSQIREKVKEFSDLCARHETVAKGVFGSPARRRYAIQSP